MPLPDNGIRLFNPKHNIRNLWQERTVDYNVIIESGYTRKL